MTWEEVKRAKERFERELLRKANVIGLAVGKKVVGGEETEELCVVVLVRRKVAEAELRPQDLIPRRVDDVKTDVVETGEVRALGLQVLKSHRKATDRWRPAPGGVSVGHHRVSAGTLGCVVQRGSEAFILSNNHILADSNRGRSGDSILQPAPLDGGKVPDDTIALLEEFVPIRWSLGLPRFLSTLFQRRNRVDCGIARPTQRDDLADEVRLIGAVRGTEEASIDLPLLKSGRTTGLTKGRVTHLEATVSVTYGRGRVALFEDQILAPSMSEGGDSGSLVVDEKNRAVGLLFAGNDKVTVLNRIENVLIALKAKM
ncbi:MAG: hypothetical protein ACE5HJ_05915 [Thermoplasmata archaeon]